MKIKDIIKILEITEGKLIQDQELETKRLPKDMYDEFNCTIHGVTKPLEELDFIHLVRSYKNKIRDLTDGYVSRDIYEMIFNKCQQLEKEVRKSTKSYPKYDFCEIPNDSEGQEFIDNVKKYLNTNKYKMRVRGQHVKEEYKGTGVTDYGQNIQQSTHLRVYIEEK
tara:strand:- start:437 stop:934 length:498 start_codon:yes stop_codon:yes gene_type:complete